MPGLAEPQGKNADLYADDDPNDLDELATKVLSVEEAEAQELPPTLVGTLEDSVSGPRKSQRRSSEPLVFYVEDKTHGRLRLAAAVLFAVFVGLVILGNWIYALGPAGFPSSAGDAEVLTNAAPPAVVPVPVQPTRPVVDQVSEAALQVPGPMPRQEEPGGAAERVAQSAARYGEVEVTSVPLGAEVFVDGYRVGRTPLHGLRLPAGRYRLELRSKGRTQPIELSVRPGEQAKAAARF